ncbi:hypothetical protein BDV59DRAFT_188407 [Aspergillus ambiguus]|uniref:uncharacterized protein n=1 Tax=Aspergillus ambiguus TaxID=176160 RepID=UPI003CCCC785
MWLASGLSPLLLFLSLFLSLSLAQSITTDLFYWPLSAPKPSLLARIAYDPTTLKSDLLAYTPPALSNSEADTDQLVRVGLYTSTATSPSQWIGTLSSRAALREDHAPILQLRLGPSNEIYHVAVISAAISNVSPSTDKAPAVQLLLPEPGPRPHLNRPVVVGPDGTNPDEPVEKTFLQKYWWIILIVSFLAMSGGGEGQ